MVVADRMGAVVGSPPGLELDPLQPPKKTIDAMATSEMTDLLVMVRTPDWGYLKKD